VTRKQDQKPAIRGLFRAAMIVMFAFCYASFMHAGGPEYVAGSSYFNSSTMGQPIVWVGGQINYYTDQGNLSPILPNSEANSLVANSFLQWTSVSTAIVVANAAGQLAEDVNGSNIEVNSSGTVTAPADITPSATQTPVVIVYDYDGTVTDALLGEGAGDASQCFWNAVYGGPDNFGTAANFNHALVVINGQCALQSSQLTDVEYRLVRVLGEVLGLGWSQLNLNVITGNPPPTSADFAGFPVMHYTDPVDCVPITICYANPYQLAPDDIAALSRLYPTSSPPPAMARIYGSVYFSSHLGGQGQPMQGVNVFARWIDPVTNQPSHQYAASSVSGFLFTGNAGNPITGWTNPLGTAYSQFGSDNQTLEGFFDLGGLPIPNGESTAHYQLSIEALDQAWSAGVAPYENSQVTPSGTFEPLTVTVNAGEEFQQDIQVSGSGQAVAPWSATETWSAPAVIPPAGDWVGSLSGYGDTAYFQVTAQSNRTFSVAVTALDEAGASSESKAEPVVGVWTSGDPQGTAPPAFTAAPFNSETFAMSLLEAQVLSANSFIVGISDLRGDGRPDYQYHAHVLYGDSVIPQRVPVSGGPVAVEGIGLTPTLNVAVGNTNIPAIATSTGQILLSAPAQSDGAQTITITDPVSGAASTMTGALTFGAAANDKILLLLGSNPPTPVETQAANPVRVRVVAADGVTPVWGATVGWSGGSAALSSCGGGFTCSVTTDEGGNASTLVTPTAAGAATITATLAPGVYNPSQSVSGTLDGTSASQSIGVTTPYLWIAQGASLSVPLIARVVSFGSPKSGITVNFTVDQGTGSLSSSSAVTNSAGYATVTLSLTDFTANVQLSACVAPGPGPCASVYGNAVGAGLINLQAVAGGVQTITGQVFQPVTVRVTDSSSPPNPVLGASVLFQSTVMRPSGDGFSVITGDTSNPQGGMPSILGAAQNSVPSDANGLASIVPSVGSFNGLLEIEIQISAGSSASIQDVLETFP
jgi:hypothetical protein